MKSCAAVLIAQCHPLELIDVEIPALKLGQVLVRVLTTGICGSQLGEIDGVKGRDPYLPHLLGHEGCGEVLEVGDGVRTVKPGDRVVLHWRKGAGLESTPAVYGSDRGPINAGWVTTFQELTVVSENRITAIPDDFDPMHAALLGCAVTTGFGAVSNDAGLRVGESVAVFGSGGVGLAAILAARLAGAHPIIAIDLIPSRLQLARRLGADFVIDSTVNDVVSLVQELTGGGADVVIENTGLPAVIGSACSATAATGRVVLVGVPPTGSAATIDTLPLHFNQRLVGSCGGGSLPARDIPRLVRLVTAGRLDLSLLVGRVSRLADISDAIAAARSGETAGRVILQCS